MTELNLSNTTFTKLSDPSISQAEKDQLATASVLPKLRIFFNTTAHAIEIETTDVIIKDSVPDQTVDNDCHHKVTAKNTKLDGTILHDSSLMFGVSKLTWKTANVFVDARLDAKLSVDGDVKVWDQHNVHYQRIVNHHFCITTIHNNTCRCCTTFSP